MAYEVTDQDLQTYHTMGYVVFRGIIPPSLLCDLRREAEKAKAIARRVSGPDSQRLQPLTRYAEELDLRPFRDYSNLPDLRKAVDTVLPHENWWGIREGKESGLGVLIEPAENPWCTSWHRDWRDNAPGLPLADWEPELTNLRLFNQVNCALYEDTSTWVVPGSHMRRDLPAEAKRFPTRPIQGPQLEGKSAEERERICLEYCRSLPGAMQVHLQAGDFMLYRNSLWHIGNYVPYKKRATLHDYMNTPEFAAWMARTAPIRTERQKQGKSWELSTPVTELSPAKATR